MQRFLAEQTRKNITVSYIDSKTVKVNYPVSMGFLSKDISANLTYIEMTGSDLLVSVDAGLGTDKMLTTLLNMQRGKMPMGMIERLPNNRLRIHLGQAAPVQAIFNRINVTDVYVLSSGLQLEGVLK